MTTERRPDQHMISLARQWTKAHRFVLVLLAGALAVRILWAAAIPAFQSPDETKHYAYVQYLGEHVTLTADRHVAQEIGVAEALTGLSSVPFHPDRTQNFAVKSLDGPRESDVDALPHGLRKTVDQHRDLNNATDYPPAYYLIASLVYRLFSATNVFTMLFAVRILSAVMSTVTVFFGYLTFRRFFADEHLARSGAAIVAFLPMYAYMGAMVNPDVLVWLLFSIFLYLCVRAYDDGLSPAMNAAIGATLVAGALVKQTFLIAVPIYGLLLAFLWYRRLLNPRQAVSMLGLVLAMLIVIDGWVYLSGVIRTSPSLEGGDTQSRTIDGFFSHLYKRWDEYVQTFDQMLAGSYGWLDTHLSERIYAVTRTITLVSGIGLMSYLVAGVVKRSPDLRILFFCGISLIYVAGWVVLNYLRITSGESWLLQGRYFFPILVPVVALLMRGMLWYVPNRRARDGVIVLLPVGVLLLSADVLLGYVLPRYYI